MKMICEKCGCYLGAITKGTFIRHKGTKENIGTFICKRCFLTMNTKNKGNTSLPPLWDTFFNK